MTVRHRDCCGQRSRSRYSGSWPRRSRSRRDSVTVFNHESLPAGGPPACHSPARALTSSGNPYPLTNPPFYVISHGYDVDITTSGIFFSKMSYTCHIHVISFFQKRHIWIYLVYPKLKNLQLVYTWYIFSCHMPCLSMSYLCHKFVRLSCPGSK